MRVGIGRVWRVGSEVRDFRTRARWVDGRDEDGGDIMMAFIRYEFLSWRKVLENKC